MARARNIKPGFFRNADLVELPFETRLLFIGLWTLADREGRLEDRPKQIKMEIFPADSVDCDALIGQLAEIGVVVRYSHDGKRYLQVVNFCKHQNPHRDEKASTIPDRNGNLAAPKEAPGKHHANTVQTQCNDDSNTVAIGLIPDSLIPDSLNLNPEEETAAVADQSEKSGQSVQAEKPKRGAVAPVARPADVDESVWADFIALRKAKRAAMTQTALNGFVREAERAGMTLQAVLEMCCAKGWQGFEASWVAPKPGQQPSGQIVSHPRSGNGGMQIAGLRGVI